MKHLDAAQSRVAQLANEGFLGVEIADAQANGMRQHGQASGVQHALDRHRQHRARSVPHKWAPFRPGSGETLLRNWSRSPFRSGRAQSADAPSKCGPTAPLRPARSPRPARASSQSAVGCDPGVPRSTRPATRETPPAAAGAENMQADERSRDFCSGNSRAQFDSANQIQAARSSHRQRLVDIRRRYRDRKWRAPPHRAPPPVPPAPKGVKVPSDSLV